MNALPKIIDGPGRYNTRAGKIAEVQDVHYYRLSDSSTASIATGRIFEEPEAIGVVTWMIDGFHIQENTPTRLDIVSKVVTLTGFETRSRNLAEI